MKDPLETDMTAYELFPRKMWTVRECQRLVEDEILDGAKYELIEGDIVRKMSHGRLHILVMAQLIEILTSLFGSKNVQTQAPIGIGEIEETSDPEPDAAVLSKPLDQFLESPPNPAEDVRLVVEVSDTTLRGDTSVKARLYARSGIPDYWVVDIKGRRLIVFRDPTSEGYQRRTSYDETESASPLAAPESEIAVASLLP